MIIGRRETNWSDLRGHFSSNLTDHIHALELQTLTKQMRYIIPIIPIDSKSFISTLIYCAANTKPLFKIDYQILILVLHVSITHVHVVESWVK